jgi:hypothetical protein
MSSGIARRMYLENMEARDKKKVLFFDFPIFNGSISPMTIKLIMLKIVPKINPLPMGSWPARIKTRPAKMAAVMALEQYFFWVCLIDSIVRMVIVFFLFGYFKDLSVSNNPAADNAQQGEHGDEDTFGSQKPIQIPADKKTKKNTTDHGQTELRNDG